MCEVCNGTVPFPDGPATKAEAIRTIEHSRDIHREWAEYMEAHPSFEPGSLGSARHHRHCIVRYERVLEVLMRITEVS